MDDHDPAREFDQSSADDDVAYLRFHTVQVEANFAP
jgi:hypothetical protein